MPCYSRMKAICLRGLIWLYLLSFGFVVLSLEPGFLDFDNLPDTNFSCVGKVIGGYYADLETNCQMFHVCTIGQLDEPMDIRFLCLNGTVFDQETRVCERIDEVDCSKSEKFYSLNLELYGNTQPSIAEDNAEADPPIIIKASTTTTTTTTQKPTSKATKAPFFTTPVPTAVTKVISAHHFPISNGPDIRFNPEEINISLNPGSAPSVRSKTVSYQQQVFSSNDNNKKVVVTTHTSYGTSDKDYIKILSNTQRPQVASTQKVQSPATPADINYGFTYHESEQNNHQDYTEPPHNYQYQHSYRHGQFRNQFKTTTYRTEHLPTTRKHPYSPNKEATTYRTPFVSSVKAPTYQTYRTEKPQRLQLPLPLLPTLPPLSFSSPAPFSLGHHIETKRYSDHQAPPRIIISASASVSDNSGRRLNYSLGTIGVSPLLDEPPKSYDEYKDQDVVLDPFYHDVPKIKASRRKRQATSSQDNSEQAAVDVLKFLFDWYSKQQKTSTLKVPIDPQDITEINHELAPVVDTPISEVKNKSVEELVLDFQNSALFNRKSKFNIIGDVLSVTEQQKKVTSVTPASSSSGKLETLDYVDDNYEAAIQRSNTQTEEEKFEGTETVATEITTTPPTTLPPTTTTTEPTTTSRIMAIIKQRAKVHHKRILSENRRRYIASLNALKPKIRRRDKELRGITAEQHKVEEVTTPSVVPKRAKAGVSTRHESTDPPKCKESSEESVKSLDRNDQTTSTSKEASKISDTAVKVTISTAAPVEAKPEKLITTEALKQLEVTPKYKETTEESIKSSDYNDQAAGTTSKEPAKIFDTTVKVTESAIAPVEAKTEKLTTTEALKQLELTPKFKETAEESTKSADHNDQAAATTSKEPSKMFDTTVEVTEFAKDFTETQEENDKDIGEAYEDLPEALTKSMQVDSEPDQLEEESNVSDNIDTHYVETTTSDDFAEDFESSEEANIPMDDLSAAVNINKSSNALNNPTETESTVTENFDMNSTKTKGLASNTEDRVYSQITEEELDALNQSIVNEEQDYVDEVHAETEAAQVDNNLESVPKKEEDQKVTTLETETDYEEEADYNLENQSNVTETEVVEEEITKPEMVGRDNRAHTTLEPAEQILEEREENTNVTDKTEESLNNTNVSTTTIEEHTEEVMVSSTTSTTESYEQSTTSLYQTTAVESTTADVSPTTDPAVTAINLTPAEITTAEIPVSRHRSRNNYRRVRPQRPTTTSGYKRPNSRHRFSSTEMTSHPTRRKPKIEDVTDTITTQLIPTESLITEVYSTSSKPLTTTQSEASDDLPATDAPLYKSANPTQAETAKESLHTTPLTMMYKLNVRKDKLRPFIFNCFGKAINKFYSDPRDCRLFHYCTSGYHKNQLLDMKFVCDLGTYFDEEKLICTKTKPERCL